eukprot:7429431-Lingulodinium_polyedra.AAC.1
MRVPMRGTHDEGGGMLGDGASALPDGDGGPFPGAIRNALGGMEWPIRNRVPRWRAMCRGDRPNAQ